MHVCLCVCVSNMKVATNQNSFQFSQFRSQLTLGMVYIYSDDIYPHRSVHSNPFNQ